MPQTTLLVKSLKFFLKRSEMTYRHLAEEIGLSEASIKRLFAEQNFTLQRLDQICQILSIEISDLIKHIESEQHLLNELTEEQEKELVADIKLFLVAFLVINGWGFDDITKWYDLTEIEAIQYLGKLDKIKLIDLLPNNRIKLRISPKFTWRLNGPIQRFFTEHLQENFLESQFNSKEAGFLFPSGMLSKASCQHLNRKIKQLIQEFHILNEQDRVLPVTDRYGYSLFMAFRPWRPEIFEKFSRKEAEF